MPVVVPSPVRPPLDDVEVVDEPDDDAIHAPPPPYEPRRPLWPKIRMFFVVVLFFGAVGGIAYAGWWWRENHRNVIVAQQPPTASTHPTPTTTAAPTHAEPAKPKDNNDVRSRWDLPDLNLPPSEVRPGAEKAAVGKKLTVSGIVHVRAGDAGAVLEIAWQGRTVVCPAGETQTLWAAKRRDGETVTVAGTVARIAGKEIHLGEWAPVAPE
jgi:hypothetical protein